MNHAWSAIVPIALLPLLFHWMPLWRRNGIWFGVTVALGYSDGPEARAVLHRFRIAIWLLALAAVTATALGLPANFPWAFPAALEAYRELLKAWNFVPEIKLFYDCWDVDAVWIPEMSIDLDFECERLRVKMHLTDKKGSHIIEVVGRVVWVSLPPAGEGQGFRVGYAFEEIAPLDLKTLMSFETIWLEQGRA